MPRKKKGQPIQVAPGQEYGQRKAQEEAQAAMPVASSDPIAAAEGFNPGVEPIDAPGNEPVTAGMPVGPGPNQPQPLNVPRPNYVDQKIIRELAPIAAALATKDDLSRSTVMFLKQVRAMSNMNIDFNSGE